MTWLTPLTGAILAAVVVPPLILLYFLKLRRRPHAIACTMLWRKSIEDLQANAPFQRLRRSLLLLLQLLALLLLAFAVMQPQIRAGRPKGGRTVMLIDNSASMTASDGADGTTRLEEAKDRARARLETLYGGGLLGGSAGETMIVTFADGADIASRFSSSKRELLAAIDRVQPSHGQTHLAEALKLARAYTTNVDPDSDRPLGAPAALEVFSDGRIEDLPDQVLRGERMTYHRVGSADADNVSLTAISVERPYDRPTAVQVFAALANFNLSETVCDVQLSVDAAARAVEALVLPAAEIDASTGALVPGRQTIVFTPFELPRGAAVEVANLRPDALAADNVVQAVAPPPKQLAVALVNSRGFLVRSVLEGMSLERLELLTAAQYETAAEQGRLGRYDLVVFEAYAPAAERLPPGRYLFLGATPPLEGLEDFGETDRQVVLAAREDHPVLRFVNLDQLRIASSRLVQPGDDVTVLAEGSQGPVILAVSRGAMQVVAVTFDPARSTWPLLRSWVTFLFNAVEYLGHLGEGLTSEGFAPGEALTTRLPAAARDVALILPDGTTKTLDVSDPTLLSWGPIRFAGLYVLSWSMPGEDDPSARTFAANIAGEAEGHIAVVENLVLGEEQVAGIAGEATSYTHLWPYAIAICLGVLMLEWWVYHRKTYI